MSSLHANGLHSHLNRAPLGCGTVDLHHGCAFDKSAATVRSCHVNMDQNIRRIFSSALIKLYLEEWRQNWVQAFTSKV